jgi:protein-tyrosine phosphatase
LTVSVLFVCLGNICRSPLAEAAFRAEAGRLGLDVEIDSAGTGDWHIGHPPDPRAAAVAIRKGISASSTISSPSTRRISPT